MIKDIVYFRDDITKTGERVAYYRLTPHLKKFLNIILKKHGQIEAIILNLEDDEYGWNIGFSIGEAKKEIVK